MFVKDSFHSFLAWTYLVVLGPPEIRKRVSIINSIYPAINNHERNSRNFQRRTFVTLPRFKSGVPVTLATITNLRRGDTILLAPFPNWSTQKQDNCETGITSVYRTKVICDIVLSSIYQIYPYIPVVNLSFFFHGALLISVMRKCSKNIFEKKNSLNIF